MDFPRMKLPVLRRVSRPLVSRVLAVAAATLLIVALAAATLAPQDMSLREALLALESPALAGMRTWLVGVLGHGVWAWVAVPLLVRPVWLVPVSLGLVCAGAAVSASMAPPGKTRRRRS